ncbi:MAG: IS4 family transposase [Bacteroidota bacterium]|nr:IS4 family transposase [Bacteroidota bacterium]
MQIGGVTNWIAEELSGVSLPDKRFTTNIISIAEHLDEHTGLSFSASCGERLRKSAWRLFSTEELNLLTTHQQRTFVRCMEEETILIAEDTTDIHYHQHHKQGMGVLGGGKSKLAKGLNMHTALAVTASGESLGIVHQKIWAPKAGRGTIERHHFAIEDKETIKWIATLKAVNEQWGKQISQQVVLIGDREADFFEHYAYPKEDNIKLLVRVQQRKRRVLLDVQDMNITEVLQSHMKPLGEGSIKAWRRQGQPEREVPVEYSTATITLPPTYKQKQPSQTMQLVCVREKSESVDKMEWILLTHLPADTLEDAITICHYYACRWTIERFHYILKSGLGIEQLQINSFLRLVNALQLYALIAWHLLWLQRLVKTKGNQPAADYIEPQTIEVAEAVTCKKMRTVTDFVIATAVLGGFVPTKKQPLPGEKTLWQGLRQLHVLQKGFLAAKQKYGTG